MSKSRSQLEAELEILQPILDLQHKALGEAENVEWRANLAKIAAKRAYAETKVRIEIIEMDLGIEKPEPAGDSETSFDPYYEHLKDSTFQGGLPGPKDEEEDEHEKNPGAA